MDAADLRAFAQRDWERLREYKERAWARIKAENGVTAAVLAADSLRLAVRERDPSWPSESDRAADLEDHVRVSSALRRVPRP